jgi:surfeit locus 1 family protein
MRPRARFWWVTVAAVSGMALTARLGFWQVSRGEQKAALQAQMEHRPLLPVLDNTALRGVEEASELFYRSARLRGRWLASHTVFLDNRQMDGRPGFYVLTPLQLEGDAGVVVVQRGWAQRNFVDRTRLPSLAPLETGTVEVQGRIAPPPAKLYDFAGAEEGAIRQNLDLPRFAQEVGRPLLPLSLQQLGPPSGGLSHDWPAVDTGIAKHQGYAFQWFALSGLIFILYLWFQVVRRFFAPPR